MEIYRKYIKRILDVIISAVTLLLLSPVLLITALLVRVKLGSPVIFKQERPGLNGKIFKMYKFKTMNVTVKENFCRMSRDLRISEMYCVLPAWMSCLSYGIS